ncbi:MAG TPA: hypothetical protein VFT22_03830 [Kofleriaceae bacterium]|nr:hypothetical protein [Kofleriaceae bacterium]
MAILPRETSARRYLLGSGLWFLFWGLFVVGSAAIFEAPDAVYRTMWLLLGALLLGRGVQQLVRARKAPRDAPRDAAAPSAPGGEGRAAAAPPAASDGPAAEARREPTSP